MLSNRPDRQNLIGQNPQVVPMSCQRIFEVASPGESWWFGPEQATKLTTDDQRAYELAHQIQQHLSVQAPTKHSSGHPGGALSSFTFGYFLSKRRDPSVDQPLRISAGHLSLLSYNLQWLFGRDEDDERLASPQTIIDSFRTPSGLPGHVEAGIGDIPFGTGPLGKGTSHGLGTAFALKYLEKPGAVDVLLADGDSQEGQVMEAFRLASHLRLDNLIVHGDFNDIQLSGLPTKTVAADFAALAVASGWNVIEVQNGNDEAQVMAALDKADSLRGEGHPIFVCYYTTMGHGIALMEDGSNTGEQNFHGTPLPEEQAEQALAHLPPLEEIVKEYEPFRAQEKKRYESANRVETDIELEWNPTATGYKRAITEEKGAARKDLGATHLKALMKNDNRIVVLHADLAGSGGFDKVEKDFPDRVINVGVAEANMYMMAAGMRQAGLLPVTYTFAAFGTNEARANARLIDVNCGHTRCAVFHDCTHAGLSVGEDGETHQEQNYLNLPFYHTQVWMPGDSNQAAAMAEAGMGLIAEGTTNVYVFSPRSSHPQLTTPDGDVLYGADYVFDGKADLVRGRNDFSDKVTILAAGPLVHDAVAVADTLAALEEPVHVRVLNIGCVRPIDSAAIITAALETGHLITLEDHNIEGGLSTQVADVLADFNIPCTLRRLGSRHYFPSAKAEDLKFMAGLDTDSIENAVLDEIRAEVSGGEDAVVSAIHELMHNLSHSRFEETALPFVRRLLQEQDYLDELRETWAKRECPKDQLPDSDTLLKKLRQGLESS